MLMRLAAPVLVLAIALSANAAHFGDRAALIDQIDQGFEVALADAEEALASAEADLEAAQAELADAEANGGDVVAAQAKVDAAQADVDAANANVTAATTNVGGATALVDQMSDDQVTALNRSLNNALHNGLAPLVFDTALLQRIIDEGFGTKEIQALTQGLELHARFDQHADRFNAKGDAEKADQMRERGAALQTKFLARLDDATADAARDAAREATREAKRAAKEAAREVAREARGHGKP
jgi:hypothetical protein